MEITEYKLLNWRGDSLNAERMCADILIMQDYESVDPQSPLGGPDGTKDILCEKGGWTYVGAVYFPPLPKTFRSVKSKFIGDLKGVKKNKMKGIIFMTNQKITPTNKKKLKILAKAEKANCIILDNEAIRALLDSALGFPVRLQHLKIKLNKAEQIAFFSKQQNKIPQLLDFYSSNIIKSLSHKIDECCENTSYQSENTDEILNFGQRTIDPSSSLKPKSDKSNLKFPSTMEISTKKLDSDTLKFIHQIMLYESGSKDLGSYRKHQIWIGSSTSSIQKATFVPPEAEKVSELTEKLLLDWRNGYDKLKELKKNDLKIEKIALFHNDFLAIHPFLDGNGRVARFILNQQVSELIEIQRRIIIEDRPSYFSALTEGQKGNIEPLKQIIIQTVFGDDSVSE